MDSQTLSSGTFDAEVGPWREMIIPVEVPHINVSKSPYLVPLLLMHNAQILAAVRVRILSSPVPKTSTGEESASRLPLYAGQPISAELSIRTSFHWSSNRGENQTYRMRFDVEELVRDWLVSGRKRGDFIARVYMHSSSLCRC